MYLNNLLFMKSPLLLVLLLLCGSISVSASIIRLADYQISFSNITTARENAYDGSFTIAVTSNGSLSVTDTVTVTYSANGKALVGVDYVAIPLTVKIPVTAGSGSITIPVHPIDDRIVEYTEGFAIVIQSAIAQSGATVALPERPGSFSIQDDDENNTYITFKGKTDGIEGSRDATVTVGFPEDYLASETITIDYSIYGGTADGKDFDGPDLVIPAGQNSVTATISILNNYLKEDTEDIILDIYGAHGAEDNYFIYPAYGRISINIFDDDSIPVARGLLRFSSDGHPGTEGSAANPGSFTLGLLSIGDLPITEPITVSFVTSGSATDGTDYTIPQTFVIPVADTILSIISVPVSILDDNIIEGNEVVEIAISNISVPSGITIDSYTRDRGYVGIYDDDSSNITIAGAVNGKEGALPGSITLSYADNLVAAEDVQVAYHIEPSGTTATQGADFTIPDAVIPAGQHSAIIPITITDDNAAEDTEYIRIVTDSAYGSNLHYQVGPLTDVVVSIADNDRASTHCPSDRLIIPNVITPNGDGRNDKFMIRGLEEYPGSKLYVYNLLRGGRLVYQSKDYKNDWEGQGCYQGLYSYILEVKDGGRMKIYRGKLIIIR
jgi:gliding motility-associated-like protein